MSGKQPSAAPGGVRLSSAKKESLALVSRSLGRRHENSHAGSIADKAAGLAQTSVASGAAPYHQLDAALLQSHALRLGQPFPVPGTGPGYSSSNLRHNGAKRPAATSCQSAVEDIAEELLLTNSQFANMSHEKRMKITSQLADRSLMLDNPVSSSRHNRAQQLQQQHQLPQHQQRGASLAAVKLRGRSRGASVRVSSLRSAVTWHCSGQAPESGAGTPGTARMQQQQQQQAPESSSGGGTAGMALASSSAVQDSQLALLRCLDLHGAQVEVEMCKQAALRGRRGLVALVTLNTVCLVTPQDSWHVIPKAGSMFSIELPSGGRASIAGSDIAGMGLYSKSHPYRRKGCHAARCACCATCTQASSTGWVEIHVEGEAASYRSGQSLLAIGQVTAQMAEIIKACDNLVPAVTPLAHRTCAEAAAAALAVGKRLQGQEQPMPSLCSTPTQAAAQPGPAHSPCPHHLPDQPLSHPSQLQGSSQHHPALLALLHLPGLSILTRPATNPVTSPAVEQQPIIHTTKEQDEQTMPPSMPKQQQDWATARPFSTSQLALGYGTEVQRASVVELWGYGTLQGQA
ncbi:hypothetical protein QJQ45_028117 [Haematococcus lacustris]|nr:hypothetical protein QJQ45_028117 [Haematococcus lacustris]